MPSRSLHLILLCAVLLFLCTCEQQSETGPQRPPLPVQNVQVATVVEQQVTLQNEIMGTVTAIERADIAARVSGVIKALPVTLGSTVSQGDVLARIDAGEISARMSQAETRLEQARRNLERERRLLAKEAATRERIKELEEAVRIAEAGYREAQTMFGYTIVTAPFNGLVAKKKVNTGDFVSAGSSLLVLENNRSLQVLIEVPETLALRIQPNDELPVTVPAANFSGKGRLAEIAPMVDPLSRTATIKIDIAAAARLRPGQFARVTITGKDETALLVPESAVQTFGQMEKIFVVQDGEARLRLVRSGARREGMVEILSGVNRGEQVVIANSNHLSDGQPVKVTP